jgi:hypothetical protein
MLLFAQALVSPLPTICVVVASVNIYYALKLLKAFHCSQAESRVVQHSSSSTY